MKHQDDTGRSAIHPAMFVDSVDPSLDPDNEVTAGKCWLDTDTSRLMLRNAGNTDWEFVGGADV